MPARLLTNLKSDEAETAWRALIEHNPDRYDYYQGFLSTRGLGLGMEFVALCKRLQRCTILSRCTNKRRPRCSM
jgi:peptide alpha-N-acetyltransferase